MNNCRRSKHSDGTLFSPRLFRGGQINDIQFHSYFYSNIFDIHGHQCSSIRNFQSLLNIIFFICVKHTKITSNSEVCDLGLGHVGHVTYCFINMLFTSTHIFNTIVGGRHYRKFPFKCLWEQGYQFPRKIDIRFHKLHGTLHFKQIYKLYFICNINLRIDILLYVCFLHIKNHIWEFWQTCYQVGDVSYTVKPAHVVTSIKRSPV